MVGKRKSDRDRAGGFRRKVGWNRPRGLFDPWGVKDKGWAGDDVAADRVGLGTRRHGRC